MAALALRRFGAPVLMGCVAIALAGAAGGAEAMVERGRVRFEPAAGESHVAERFRVRPHTFEYEMRRADLAPQSFDVWEVTFPSPIQTPCECNNTVHCEYFRPRRDGKAPGVVVLHILGGDFALSRLFCNALAQRGAAALFVKMPYYGPRRDPANPRRMISADPRETVEGMTQAVQDIRCAAAWLASRGEIDRERLGIFGISLGGITGALAAAAEPRLANVCLLLAGGDLGKVAWESRELAKVRQAWEARGGTQDEFVKILSEVDPVRYAASVRGRRILMMNARSDEVIPRVCTESLWQSLGKPPIHWYDGGHYSCAWHLLDAIDKVQDFFADSP